MGAVDLHPRVRANRVQIGLGCLASKAVVLSFFLLLLPLWESVIVLCFVVRRFVSVLVLQSS